MGYFVSLRDGDQGGGGKRTIRLNAKKQKCSSVMMAIVERGRVYAITNLLYFTLTGDFNCCHISAQPANL